MERRKFLKQSALASSLFFVPSFVKAFETNLASELGYKRLVIVQLSGGNDGLNTVIPFRNDIYYKSRPNISISKSKTIKLTDDLAFHSSLLPLKRLYDKGYLSIINNVGYPNPNRSHFRATDIWQTASASNQYLQSGWIGRYLDAYGNHPYNAIEIDESMSLALKGERATGIALTNPEMLYKISQDPYLNNIQKYYNDEHLSEHNLGYLYKSMITAKSSATYIHNTNKTWDSKTEYPKTPFANQLKTIGRFINSGLQTRVFYASLGGFDTHVNQLNSQKRLLDVYAEGVEAFVKDLKKQNTFKDTLILTFSEFGRRVKENSGKGTDHGSANNVFIIGENLKKQGVYNNLAALTDLDDNGDIKFEIDFRSIYATVLSKWLHVNEKPVLNKEFEPLHFI
ncbi:DUF1501 domain-containing protein [Corallibacter sp.]|uniref:DUF1501 domain-containing protein n=1 Tax=Corallibacter sp. TaxID=2038084 RepID=UPI003A8FD00B